MNMYNGCSIAGASYLFGIGGPVDVGRSLRFFRIACENDAASGCSTYAQFMLHGTEMKRDPEGAMKIYSDRCERSEGAGLECRVFAWGLLEGVGVPKDERRAVETFERACELDDDTACGILAAFYEDGRIVRKDHARSKSLCERVARLFETRNNAFSGDVPSSCPIRDYDGTL